MKALKQVYSCLLRCHLLLKSLTVNNRRIDRVYIERASSRCLNARPTNNNNNNSEVLLGAIVHRPDAPKVTWLYSDKMQLD